jgi:CubicO group peptidase (beta-lactamase class C family)
MWLLIAALFLCAVYANQVPLATSKAEILDAQADDFINHILKEWNSPGGIGVAVVRRDGDKWHVDTKGYGKGKADGTAISPGSRFCIGSNSKVCPRTFFHNWNINILEQLFDVMATGLLVSNDSLSSRISWDTKLKSIIPDWEVADSIITDRANIVDAMSHRTGLPRHDLMYDKNDTISSIVSCAAPRLPPSSAYKFIAQTSQTLTGIGRIP